MIHAVPSHGRLTLELSGARQLARLMLTKIETTARNATDAARRPLQRFVRRQPNSHHSTPTHFPEKNGNYLNQDRNIEIRECTNRQYERTPVQFASHYLDPELRRCKSEQVVPASEDTYRPPPYRTLTPKLLEHIFRDPQWLHDTRMVHSKRLAKPS